MSEEGLGVVIAAGKLAQKAADAGQRRAVLDQETYALNG